MAKDRAKVSVIVPVYNAEQYLGECLDGFLDQTLRDFELICVDDGSTDGSTEILADRARKDGRVRVVRQENAGPGVARNRGLDLASGEYVYFFDCDDFCEPCLLERAVSCADETSADVVVLPFDQYDERVGVGLYADWGLRRERYPEGTFAWRDNPDQIFETFHNYPWNKLVRRSFLAENNIRFQEIYLTEDLMYSAPVLVLARRIACLEGAYLSHREGISTNSMSGKHKHPFDFIEAFKALRTFLEQEGIYAELETAYVNWALNGCVYNLMTLKNRESFAEVFDRLYDGGLEEMGLESDSAREKRSEAYRAFCGYVESGDREGLMFSEFSESRPAAELAGYKAAVEFKINEEQRVRMRSLESRVREMLEERDGMKAELARRSAELEQRTRERDEIARVHDEIMNAAEQKVGQAICYIPRIVQRWWLERRQDGKEAGNNE